MELSIATRMELQRRRKECQIDTQRVVKAAISAFYAEIERQKVELDRRQGKAG